MTVYGRILRFATMLVPMIAPGCSGSRSEVSDATRIVSTCVGREFLLPDSGTLALNGREAVGSSRFTIVNYVDREGCTNCRLRLRAWTMFMNELDSLGAEDVECVHYVGVSDTSKIAAVVRRELYDGIVLADSGNFIASHNPLPEDVRFNTFLLDSARRVLAVGNPTYLPELKRLYISLITGRPYRGESRTMTEARQLSDSHDFGTVAAGSPNRWTTWVVNLGSDTLRVDGVSTSCDCTSATFSPSAAAPGDSIRLDVVFIDSVTGEFVREIEMYCNTAGSPMVFEITGTIADIAD